MFIQGIDMLQVPQRALRADLHIEIVEVEVLPKLPKAKIR